MDAEGVRHVAIMKMSCNRITASVASAPDSTSHGVNGVLGRLKRGCAAAVGAAMAVTMAFAGTAAAQEITLYSGRGEPLVAPIIKAFERETGIRVKVRYGGTSELAVLLQEEGDRTPADLFWAQDGGALGATATAGLFAVLPETLYGDLPEIYTSRTGLWVATSGRARVLAYSPERAKAEEMPRSVFELTEERYRGRVAWAPTNGSFQSFVTAMRVEHGEERTREWLEAMRANGAKAYRNNSAQVQAVADGEVDFALTNNYYLLRFKARDSKFPVAQSFFEDGDIGNLVNVAGIGVLAASERQDDARRFVEFLLSSQAQQFFTSDVYEYPVRMAVIENPNLDDLETVLAASPRVDLDALRDLEGTLALLRRVELL